MFAAAADDLHEATRAAGIAALWIRNSFTCGELGYYPRHLAEQGFLAVAAANSPALMSVGGAPRRPRHQPAGLRHAATGTAAGRDRPGVLRRPRSSTSGGPPRPASRFPPGGHWAPTVHRPRMPGAALEGTLLPFGGHRGGNIALLVEILATLSGAAFSLDAAPFDRGADSPGIGVFVLGIDPASFGGSIDRLTGSSTTSAPTMPCGCRRSS